MESPAAKHTQAFHILHRGGYNIGKKLFRAEYNYLNFIALEGLNKVILTRVIGSLTGCGLSVSMDGAWPVELARMIGELAIGRQKTTRWEQVE